MVDLKAIRQKLEEYEAEGEADEDSDEDTSFLMGVGIVPGWKQELNDVYVSAPLSIGSGILLALAFDAIKNRGEDSEKIFQGGWKDAAMVFGSMMFGFGAGKLSRGMVAQKESEYHQNIIAKAEEKVKEAEEAKEAEEQKNQQQSYSILTAPTAFQLAPSNSSLNVFGEYGSALGQPSLSYNYMG